MKSEKKGEAEGGETPRGSEPTNGVSRERREQSSIN